MTEQWHSYQAVADALGVKVNSVRARRRRGNWQHRINNETGKAEVYVDLDVLVDRKGDVTPSTTTLHDGDVTPALVTPSNEEITVLKVQLATLTEKSSQLEQRIDELKVDQQEKREIIEGLLQVLQDKEPPPSRSLFSWLLGR